VFDVVFRWGFAVESFGGNKKYTVGSEVFTVVTMKSVAFWDVMPCSLVEFYPRSSTTSVNFHCPIRCHIPEEMLSYFWVRSHPGKRRADCDSEMRIWNKYEYSAIFKFSEFK
jgi:hypothetical protein